MKLILSDKQIKELASNYGINEIDIKAKEADRKPTKAQKNAGNYRMGHVIVKGMKISIENPQGSKRYWTNSKGEECATIMNNHYGYFSKSLGKDGDAVDVFLGPNLENFDKVYVVDQNIGGHFDESKVMLGFDDIKSAKAAYLSNYDETFKGFRCITGVPLSIFKKWLYRGRKQRKPFRHYILAQKNRILKENKA